MSVALRTLRQIVRKRRDRRLRRVMQLTGTSCGVACMAMLSGLGFHDAMRVGHEVFGKDEWEGSHRTHAADLREMMEPIGLRLGRKVSCRTWRQVPPGALVAVQCKRRNGVDEWHWVVSAVDEEGLFFFDPRRSVKAEKRRDFLRVRPSWYHRVQHV
jgi:hypothetical protein